jgi:Ca2+-binding EF-hand superfamily protein
MKKQGTRELDSSQLEARSKVFSGQELEVFKRVFSKLSKNGTEMPVSAYVNHMKELSKNQPQGVLSVIIADLEEQGENTVDLKGFVGLLEQVVGDLESTEGLQKIFTFVTRDPIKKRVNLEDLQKVRQELGLNVTDKDLQRLINFVTSSYKERTDFTFDEFKRYVVGKN